MLPDVSQISDPAPRLDRLVRAFAELAAVTPQLEVGFQDSAVPAEATTDADGGIDIRLGCPDTDSAAVLRLRRNGAVLRAISPARPGCGTVSLIEDQLGVYLDRGYRWGDTVFSSADDLAATLLDHMTRRLAALDDGGLAAYREAATSVTASAPRSAWPRGRRARPAHAVRRVPGASSGRL